MANRFSNERIATNKIRKMKRRIELTTPIPSNENKAIAKNIGKFSGPAKLGNSVGSCKLRIRN